MPEPKLTALPSPRARALAFLAIIVAGVAGGLIGWSYADIECTGNCGTISGVAALAGGAVAAGGVAIVAVLALRAMGEWRRLQDDSDDGTSTSRRNASA